MQLFGQHVSDFSTRHRRLASPSLLSPQTAIFKRVAVDSAEQQRSRRTVQVCVSQKLREPELGALEAQVEKSLKPPPPPKDVLIKFEVPYKTSFGQIIKAVGAPKSLGAWNAKAALSLHWTEGDNWVGEIYLPAGKYDFKVIVVDTASDQADWEQGENRILQVPAFPGTLEVPCVWNKPVMATRFIDAPVEVFDPCEVVAAQAAAAARAASDDVEFEQLTAEAAELGEVQAAQAAKLEATRQSIKDNMVQLISSSEPPLPPSAAAAASQPAPTAAARPTITPAPGPDGTMMFSFPAATPAPPAAAPASPAPAAAAPAAPAPAAPAAPAPAAAAPVAAPPAPPPIAAAVEQVLEASPAPAAPHAPPAPEATEFLVAVAAAITEVALDPAAAPVEAAAATTTTPVEEDAPAATPHVAPAPTANNVVPAPPGMAESKAGARMESKVPVTSVQGPPATAMSEGLVSEESKVGSSASGGDGGIISSAAAEGEQALGGMLAETPAANLLNDFWGFLAKGGRR